MKWFILLITLLITLSIQTGNFTQTDQKCNTDTDCGTKGKCVTGLCQCFPGYATYPPNSKEVCNYEKFNQKTAFLYELFFGFGAGNFYSGRNTHAALKLVSFIFGIYIICLFPITAKFISQKLDSECVVITVSCFYYFCSLGLAFWFVYDLVQFGMNNYMDGNGMPLEPW